MNNELFIFLHFLIEFCSFEAKIRWIFIGISPKFLENLKICRESDIIPKKLQYFSGKLQKKIGKLWNYSIFGLNNSFPSLVLTSTQAMNTARWAASNSGSKLGSNSHCGFDRKRLVDGTTVRPKEANELFNPKIEQLHKSSNFFLQISGKILQFFLNNIRFSANFEIF